MKTRPTDTTREKREDFKGKQVRFKDKESEWSYFMPATGCGWEPGLIYEEVLPDDAPEMVPAPVWITDRMPTVNDAMSLERYFFVLKMRGDGSVRLATWDEIRENEPWCRIIIPKDPPKSVEDKAFEEAQANVKEIYARPHHECPVDFDRHFFNAGIRFAKEGK